ncbi:MAG: NAD(P)-binding protein [Oscillospiraceae bacterium]
MVIGAGIGGLMAAEYLKARGHNPTVYEATDAPAPLCARRKGPEAGSSPTPVSVGRRGVQAYGHRD